MNHFTSLKNLWMAVMLLFCHFISAQIIPTDGIVYVTANGTGNGSSWSSPTSDLQGAIYAANVQKVFVAVGNYDVPSPSSFMMKEGVAIYGGFDPGNNIDDLSDVRILPNHGVSEGSVLNGKNERPVIWNDNNGLTNAAILDGFTIKNGFHPTVGNSIGDAGGIYLRGVSPTLKNLVIKENQSVRGGGIFITGNSSPVITYTIIKDNEAMSGGGICNYGYSPILTNVEISGNRGTDTNGADGAGIFNEGKINLLNSTIAGNIPNAVYNNYYAFPDGGVRIYLNNSLIVGQMNGFYTNVGSLWLPVDLGTTFVNPQTSDYRLKIGASAINAGINDLYPDLDENTLDLGGNPRLKNGTIDQGAYEYQSNITNIVITPDENGIVYVKKDGSGDGSSWSNATGDLQKAINALNVQQVWVTIGNYATGIGSSFKLKNNVAIYGGFDPDNHIDDLSDARILPDGENNANIGSILNGNTINRVVQNIFTANQPLNETAVLDGFTLTGGYTPENGGAMYNEYASPTLANLVIKGSNSMYGAGIYNKNSAPAMSNITITGNTAIKDGGGIYNKNSSPAMLNINIMNNSANYGGGIFNQTSASPQMVNVLVKGNNSNNDGGAMYNDDNSLPILINTTIAGNSAVHEGKAIYNRNSSVSLNNSIIYGTISGDAYTANYSLIEGNNNTDNNNLDATLYTEEQIFTNLLIKNYTLKENSPAIDAGNNDLYPDLDTDTKDLAGNMRLIADHIDLGAYEAAVIAPILPDVNGIVYVKENATGNGSDWVHATGDLQRAINAQNAHQIWVAIGNYTITEGESLKMKNSIAIYGGFDPDNGIDDLSDERILPDANNNNIGSVINGNHNQRIIENIFTPAEPLNETAMLDGFTLTGGNTPNNGGAIYNEYASPVFTNLVISNSNAQFGGGVYNKNSSPEMKNITIINNSAQWDGGAIYNKESSPSMVNIKIINNNANYAGGVFNQTSAFPQMINVLMSGNTSNNEAGAMYNDDGSLPVLINSTLAGNTGLNEIHNRNASVSVNNSIVFGTIGNSNGGTYSLHYSLVQGNSDFSNGNLNPSGISLADIFTDPANGDYTLKNGAVAVDAGNNDLFTDLDENTLDLAGNPRLNGTTIDLGAYESSIVPITPDANNILYVDINVSGGNGSGNSWTNAIPQLADAMKYARQQYDANNTVYDATPLKIYVAKGTYKPMYSARNNYYTVDEGRDNAFVMVKNVQVYGGFDPGSGIDDLSDTRIFGAGGSILSGDIGVAGQIDNVFHVVVSSDDVASTLLDGFTIREAYGVASNGTFITVNGYPVYRYFGAIYNVRSSPSYVNCLITENILYTGAGMYNHQQASPTITNCSFINNFAFGTFGGAIYNVVSCSPVITNCTFTNNSGSAIYNSANSSPIISNCSFTDNPANEGGAIYNNASSPIIINSLFTNNGNTIGIVNGGAIYNEGASSPQLTNVSIANNYGLTAVYSTAGSTTINNSIVLGGISGTYTPQYSLIEGNTDFSNGNINASGISVSDIFTDPANGDYTLKEGAVAVNAGNNALYPGLDENTLDLAGNQRLFGTNIDLGAYESTFAPASEHCLYATTWNGTSWSNGVPDYDTQAIIDGDLVIDYELDACEVVVTPNGSLRILADAILDCDWSVTNLATADDFVIENNGNLIQWEEVENTGAITVKRESQPMIRLDYTLWSSPVVGQNLFNFSPETVNGVTNYPGSTGRIYVYDGANGYVNPNPFLADTEMNSGMGYLFRSPNNFDSTVPAVYEGIFTGVPFNGDLSVPTVANNYTSIGNPYPSNIEAYYFIYTNPEVSTLYFWNNNHDAGNNYATCTLGNCVAASGGGNLPNGIISAGQGFIVATSGTSVNFNNLMRTDDTAVFSKTDETEKHRFWLNLNDDESNGYNQILVSYMDEATNGIDNRIDAPLFGYEGSALYNLIDNDSFVIQGRALPFEASDVVPLGFRAAQQGKFIISLDNFDGLFAEGNVTVYLKDKQMNIIHNLMESDYDFESTAGEFNDRFEIVYGGDGTMGINDLASGEIQIYKDNDFIVVESKSEKILSVELFDLSGRNIYRNDNVNSNLYKVKSAAKGILVVRAQTQNGKVETKKVINR